MADKSKHSLIDLTQEFVNLLINANGEEVDLNTAGHSLGASKRRLYDVTNVLAGIGVVERCGKARVRWVRNAVTTVEQPDLTALITREQELDRMTALIDESLAQMIASQEFESFAWVTEEDLVRLADEDLTLFALRGPPDLEIEMPEDDGPMRHRLVCSSETGVVDLILIHQPGK
jgi:transcription factor E2F3